LTGPAPFRLAEPSLPEIGWRPAMTTDLRKRCRGRLKSLLGRWCVSRSVNLRRCRFSLSRSAQMGSPMRHLMTRVTQVRDPAGCPVHIDQDVHQLARRISCPCAKRAANASASRIDTTLVPTSRTLIRCQGGRPGLDRGAPESWRCMRRPRSDRRRRWERNPRPVVLSRESIYPAPPNSEDQPHPPHPQCIR
jgi:hypothetical protein